MFDLIYNSISASTTFAWDAQGFFEWFIGTASYWYVFLFMVVESSFIPFPSEVIVPPAAYLAVTRGDDMSVFGVILVATAGAVIGAFINYFLSLWIGRPLVYRFADSRFGHACLINRAKVTKAEQYFDNHGAVSTFIGRLIPAVRQLISIPAGLAKMNIGIFAVFTALGALLWNSILGLMGWWLGQSVPLDTLLAKIEQYNSYLSIAGIVLLVVVAAIMIYNALKTHKQ